MELLKVSTLLQPERVLAEFNTTPIEVAVSQGGESSKKESLSDQNSTVYRIFKECCNSLLDEEQVEEVFNSVTEQQKGLKIKGISIIEPSDSCPLHLAVTKTSIFFLNAIAGKGASTTVYHCKEVDTVSETLNERKVLKISAKPFKAERKLLNELSPESKKRWH